jgi:hypothetical protein
VPQDSEGQHLDDQDLLTLSLVPADEEATLPEPISPPEKKELQIVQERVAKAVLGIEVRFPFSVKLILTSFLGTLQRPEAKTKGRG